MKRTLPWLGLAASPAWAAACPDLTALQRAAGFVTWQNLLQFGGAGLVAAGTLYFARHLLLRRRTLAALLWLLVFGSLVAGAFVAPAHRMWPVLFGALILPGLIGLSWHRYGGFLQPLRWLSPLTLAWVAIALGYQVQAVGFLAVAALLSTLGVVIGVGRFCYWFGFSDDDALARATVAGALMAGVSAVLAAARVPFGPFEVFRPGALWLGSFAWYLGVLIVAVKWYSARRYLARQGLALASFAGSLGFGLLTGVGEITTLAGTFLIFWLLGKTAELPVQGRLAFGLKLMAAGLLLTAIWYGSGPVRELLAGAGGPGGL